MLRLEELTQKSGAIILLGLLFITGAFVLALPRLARHQPANEVPSIYVFTEAPGTPAEDVLDGVTRPQEEAVAGLIGLVDVRSFARDGSSVLIASFQRGTDVQGARDAVAFRLETLPLPQGAGPALVTAEQRLGLENHYVLLAVTGPGNLEDMARQARLELAQQVTGIPGVASVSIIGEPHNQVEVVLHPDQMQALEISYNQVRSLLQFNSASALTGSLHASDQHLSVVSSSELRTPTELKRLIVGVTQVGDQIAPVVLEDVADVTVAPRGDNGFWLNGKPAIGLKVNVAAQADVASVASSLRARAGQLQTAIGNDTALTVLTLNPEESTQTGWLWTFLLVGVGALLAGLLLLSLRAGAVVALSLLFSVSGGLLIAYVMHLPVDATGASILALGVAFAGLPILLAVESIWRRARASGAATDASGASLLLFSVTLAELSVPLLLLFLDKPFSDPLHAQLPLLLATIFAGGVASLIFTPALAGMLLRWGRPGRLMGPGQWLETSASAVMRMGLRARAGGVLVCIIIVAATAGASLLLSVSFAPRSSTRTLALTLFPTTGMDTQEAHDAVTQATTALAGMPGVASVATAFGATLPVLAPSTRFDVTQPVAAVQITFSDSQRFATRVSSVKQALSGLDGLQASVQAPSSWHAAGRFEVMVFAQAPDEAARVADQLRQRVSEIGGVSSLATVPLAPQLSITVEVNPTNAFSAGAGVVHITDQVRQYTEGEYVAQGRLEGGEPVPLWLKIDPAFTNSLEKLRSLPVGGNALVALGSLANVQRVARPVAFLRSNGRFASAVVGDVYGGFAPATLDALRNAVRASERPQGVRMSILGVAETQAQVTRQTKFVAVMAVLVLVALAGFAGAFPSGLLVLAGVALSGLGVVASILLSESLVDHPTLLGLVLLPGVTGIAALVLISGVHGYRQTGLPLGDALVAASKTHAVGMLLGTKVVVVLFALLAVGPGATNTLVASIARVLAAGLLTNGVFGLICLPALYALAGRARMQPPPPPASAAVPAEPTAVAQPPSS